MAKALLTDGLLSTLPAADACPADLRMVGKLLTVPAFCLPVSAEEGSSAPVQKQGVVVQNILHRDVYKRQVYGRPKPGEPTEQQTRWTARMMDTQSALKWSLMRNVPVLQLSLIHI